MNKDILFIDFETRSPVDIKKAGADVYARHPLTRTMAFGYGFNDEPISVNHIGWIPEPAVIEHVAECRPVVAHNAPFEWLIWNFVFKKEFDLPTLHIEQLQCTMAMSYAMALPGKLENAAAAAGIEARKDMQGNRIMMQLSQPREIKEDGSIVWWEPEDVPEKFEKLYAYCAQDIEVERQLYNRLIKLSPQEKEIWRLDHKINQRGVCIDLDSASQAVKVMEFEKKRLDQAMRQVTDNAVAVCTATGQLTDWIKWKGIETKGVARNDVADLLEDESLPDDVKQALLLRQEAAKSSTAKLTSMLNSTCDDGRIRGIFQYHGAGTGRWAGRRIQPQNFPRPKLKQDDVDEVFNILGRIN